MSSGSSVLTVLNSLNNLENFFADVNSFGNTYYFFVGRPNPWPNDSLPPLAENTYAEIESVWEDMVFGKIISNNNLAYMTDNFQWVSNTVYAQYDQNQPIFGVNFYVVTSNYSVYKCIDNNNGSPSTIQPTLQAITGTFKTSDGYTWKYMYTIPSDANSIFTSVSYIPVVSNTFVANNAIPGTIDVIRVENGGNNWQGFLQGYINSIVTSTQVQLSGTANSSNGFYVGSQIYLSGGLGGGQIREIIGYNGPTQTVTVNSAFSTTATLQLANNSGSFDIGYQFLQNYANVSFIYSTGSFNSGDSLYQSESMVNGTVGFVNSSALGIFGLGSNFTTGASPSYPISDIGSSPVAQTGLVTVVAGSNGITATTANLLNLTVNTFIQVGSNNFNNVRRVTSITNSSVANVSVPWSSNLTTNVFSVIPRALEPSNSVYTSTNGNITFVNLSGLEGSYGNISSVNQNFIVGELVELFNSSNVSLSANAIVAYVNTSTIILSNTSGSFSGNNYLLGTSSNTYAELFTITSFPTIVVSSSLNTWQTGLQGSVFNASNNLVGNATIIGVNFVPSPHTPFIVSPTINITGDGSDALAYAIVNNAPNASNNITEVIVINTGSGYTVANVVASGNSLFGSGANLYPVISPANGHGADALSELGATRAGISMSVNNFATENYFFPPYGSYRRSGIIKNPLFNNINLTVGNPQRLDLNLSSMSGNLQVGEVALNNNVAAGIVVSTNATFAQIDQISGAWANGTILGLTSNSSGNVSVNSFINFSLSGNSLPLYQDNIKVADLIDVFSNSNLLISNVSGKLESNLTIYDTTTNAYATVTNILSTNGYNDVTSNFGNTFNQTSRVTLSQNSITSFQALEQVTQQATEATGLILSTNGDVDLMITNVSGTFSGGTLLTDETTSANAVILWANSTYIKLSGVNGTFGGGNRVSTVAANANIIQALTVLTLANTSATPFQLNGGFSIIGGNSGAIGVASIANTINYPQLVKESGSLLYVTDSIPFTINTSSKESFLLVLSF